MSARPGVLPANFKTIERVRRYFGPDGPTQCACMARSTGMRCTQPAIKGERTCKHHGGKTAAIKRAQKAGERVRQVLSPKQAARQYHVSLAFSEGYKATPVDGSWANGGYGERGREIAAQIKRELNR